MKTFVVIATVALLGLAIASMPYSVDHAEFVYVTQFGQHVLTRDGADDAGLHVKWPWPIQSVQRIDRRLQMFDIPAAELPTFDPLGKTIDKMLTVDGYVVWQLVDERDVDQFIRTVGTAERAREILGPRIAGRIGAIISRMSLDELIQVSPATNRQADLDARMQRFQEQLKAADGPDDANPPARDEYGALGRQIRDEYGIKLVDVRLRRLNYPDSVRQTIFERIRSERKRKAADYESDGEKRAREIRSAAERDAEIARTTAQAKADLIRKQADADADRIRNEAHAKDRDFYVFLQKLETYKQMLSKTSDLLLLSSRHPLFQLLLNPPSEKPNGKSADGKRPAENESRKPGG